MSVPFRGTDIAAPGARRAAVKRRTAPTCPDCSARRGSRRDLEPAAVSRCEAEGWSGVAVADHVNIGRRGAWHPFSLLGAMAGATTRVTLTTAYANNLMRSPVE